MTALLKVNIPLQPKKARASEAWGCMEVDPDQAYILTAENYDQCTKYLPGYRSVSASGASMPCSTGGASLIPGATGARSR